MSQRDVFVWNILIRGYFIKGPCQESIIIYKDLNFKGVLVDNYTFPFVLRSCSLLSALREGREVHCSVVKHGFESDVFVQSSLISMYAQSGETLDSELVFDQMRVRNVVSWTAMIAGYCGLLDVAWSLFDQMKEHSVVSWNAIITAYEQNDVGSSAIKLFHRMLDEGVEFDYITVVTVISACARLGALDTEKWVHELVKSKGLECNVSLTNALIDMYAKCESIESARDVFDRLPNRTVVSWSSIIGACASHGRGRDAVEFFSKMKEEGIQPNSFTFTAVLTTCRHSGLVEEGRKHFESIQQQQQQTQCIPT
ncbi:hypothetical protein BC332_11635 [Capsicum chinense]|nr:hypothetical protein BC332_11635 [Capsicum chinense]